MPQGEITPYDPELEGQQRTELRRVYYTLRLSLEDIDKIKQDVTVDKLVWKETDTDGNVYEVHVKVHRQP